MEFRLILSQLALILLPLGDKPPAWAAAILRYSIQSAVKFFPIRLVSEASHLDTKRPYIVGADASLCNMRPLLQPANISSMLTV